MKHLLNSDTLSMEKGLSSAPKAFWEQTPEHIMLKCHILEHLPVEVKDLGLVGQVLQGNISVGPEGNINHQPHQLVQLALQLLNDGHVVRLLLEGCL